MSERRIIIRPEPFGAGFDITIDPPAEWANFNAERATHHEALRYARSLRVVHGWRITDQAEGGQ